MTDETTDARSVVTIVIADDRTMVRDGVRMLLGAEPGFQIVGEARDVPTAVEAVRDHRPRVLVLDLNMPGASSLGAIPGIREISPHTGVVILTMESGLAFAHAAVRAGALAYVLKESAGDELVDAVRRAADGERYLNRQVAAA